jgi:hypothetical protein
MFMKDPTAVDERAETLLDGPVASAGSPPTVLGHVAGDGLPD